MTKAKEFHVLSQGEFEGPFDDLIHAVEHLYDLCGGNYAPPERIEATVVAVVENNYADVAKVYGKPLDGKYAQWNTREAGIEEVKQFLAENQLNK